MSRHMNLGIHGSAPYLEDDVRPPAPPPKPGRVSRMLIDRSITGTFPDLPPLEPLTRFISSSPNDKPFRKRNKNIVDEERRKGRYVYGFMFGFELMQNDKTLTTVVHCHWKAVDTVGPLQARGGAQ
nr:unnamed protein product [Haemonchus contortus]